MTLLESQPRLGGVIRTERIGEYLIEHGADMFATQPGDALQLCRDLGVEDELIEPLPAGRGAMVVRDGRCHPVPEGFVLMRPTRFGAMLRTPLLSVSGKLRLMAEPFIRRRDRDDDESVASFVERRLGKEVLERIVQPLVGGIYTADPAKLSMQATMPQFVEMEQQYGSLLAATRARKRAGKDSRERSSSGARYSQFRGFPEGMQGLLNPLAAQLPEGSVRLGVHVEYIDRTSRGGSQTGPMWRFHLRGQAEPLQADAVILAVSARALASLLENVAPQVAEHARRIDYASSAIVVLGVRDSDIQRPVQTFGIVVPEVEKRSILACSFASHKFPGRAPVGRTLLRVFVGGALHPDLVDRDDARLIEIVRGELAELIGLTGEPDLTRVIRWKNAMPQYRLGHRQLVGVIERDVAKLPGLELAGNALHGVGIAPVVRTARRAAERIAAYCASQPEA